MKIIDSINNCNWFTPDHAKLMLRLAVGILVLMHGIYKLQNPASIGFVGGAFAAFGLPAFLAYLVYIGEIIAPIMLMLGYQTKIAALLVAITILVAVILVHLDQLFSVSPKGGGYALELQAMFLFGSLAIYGLGAGKYKLIK